MNQLLALIKALQQAGFVFTTVTAAGKRGVVISTTLPAPLGVVGFRIKVSHAQGL